MREGTTYSLRWMGRQSGPYSKEQLDELLKRREIGLMHEILHDGAWISLANFLSLDQGEDDGKPTTRVPPANPVKRTARQTLTTPGEELGYSPDAVGASVVGQVVGSVMGSQYAEPSAMSWSLLPERAGAGFLLTYAGFWTRVVAVVIDSTILSFAGALSALLIGRLAGDLASDSLSNQAILIVSGIAIVCGWLYDALFHSSKLQATPGKLCVGLIVSGSGGEQLAFTTATARFLYKILSGLLICAGFFMAAFSERKQALHDILCRSIVCNRIELNHLVR
jgi:uncharacterized RDD family membrane protein YckC